MQPGRRPGRTRRGSTPWRVRPPRSALRARSALRVRRLRARHGAVRPVPDRSKPLALQPVLAQSAASGQLPAASGSRAPVEVLRLASASNARAGRAARVGTALRPGARTLRTCPQRWHRRRRAAWRARHGRLRGHHRRECVRRRRLRRALRAQEQPERPEIRPTGRRALRRRRSPRRAPPVRSSVRAARSARPARRTRRRPRR